jgi:hypothetical protein
VSEAPERYEGIITIEWGAPGRAGDAASGWKIQPRTQDGVPITTVSEMTVVHAPADGLVWAELTMFADEAGRPVLRTGPGIEPAAVHGGEIATATFPFLVAGMSVRGEESPEPLAGCGETESASLPAPEPAS